MVLGVQTGGAIPNARLWRFCASFAWGLALLLSLPTAAHGDVQSCLDTHRQAQLMRLAAHYTEARENLLICAQAGCPRLISEDCIQWLAEVDALLPSVVFAVTDTTGQDLVDVHVVANDAPLCDRLEGRAVPINPGSYKLRFESPGLAPAEVVLTIRESEQHRMVRATLRPLEPALAPPVGSSVVIVPTLPAPAPGPAAPREPLSVPNATYVLGGLALASLGVGIAFGAMGRAEWNRLDEICALRSCKPREVEDGKRDYVLADVGFGVSAGLAAAATWAYFAARRRHHRARGMRASFVPTLDRDGFTFSLGAPL